MPKVASKIKNKRTKYVKGGASGLWFMGLIGSLVFYWGSIDSFWMFLVAIFKSVFWPAYIIYALHRFLNF